MAIETVYSSIAEAYNNANANHVPAAKFRGRQRTVADTFQVSATDDDGSKYVVCPVRSNWSIQSIKIFNDAITGGTDFAVGVYDTNLTAVNKDLFAAAVDLSSANTTGAEVAYVSRDITSVGKHLWEDLGMSEDPNEEYYLVVTGDVVGTADGDVSVIVTFAVD